MPTTPLQPLVDAAQPRVPIFLAPGTYDDAEPVRIDKSVTFIGGRDAIIHSEFDVTAGNTHLVGVTAIMNKVGAPMHTGMTDFYPQNGMFQVQTGAHLWLDDMLIYSEAGFSKPAIHVNGARLHLRAQTMLSVLNWINNTGPMVELFYGSYANVFCNGDETQIPMNMQSGCAAGLAAFMLAGSDLILSGANLWKGTNQAGTLAVLAGRNSYVQVGAGKYTTIQGFGAASAAISLDVESKKVIATNTYIQ